MATFAANSVNKNFSSFDVDQNGGSSECCGWKTACGWPLVSPNPFTCFRELILCTFTFSFTGSIWIVRISYWANKPHGRDGVSQTCGRVEEVLSSWLQFWLEWASKLVSGQGCARGSDGCCGRNTDVVSIHVCCCAIWEEYTSWWVFCSE